MKVINYTNKETTEISSDWRDWLEQAGYNRVPKFAPGEELTLALIESKDKKSFAVYHPRVGQLKTEYICVGIPTEQEAETLLDTAIQMINGPLSLLSAATDAVQQQRYPSA